MIGCCGSPKIGPPKKGVIRNIKIFLPMFSENVRVLKLRFFVFLGGPGGFREVREAGRNHFHLSWYLLVPGSRVMTDSHSMGHAEGGSYAGCRERRGLSWQRRRERLGRNKYCKEKKSYGGVL